MTAAALRVPLMPPVSPLSSFQTIGTPAAFLGSDMVRSAVSYSGTTYLAYLAGDGSARVAAIDETTLAVMISPAIISSLAVDIHTSPAILVRSSDHKLVVACAPHNGTHMYVAVSTNATDVSSWGAATDIASTLAGSGRYTYPHLVQLSGESGKIYLFYRDQDVIGPPSENVLCFSTSTDGGSTWTAETKLFKNTNQYCLWCIDSDDTSRIDFAVSSGSAAQDSTASLYHFYYTGGSYYKSDGTLISTSLPLTPSDPSLVYDGSTDGLVRVPYALHRNSGNPVVVWAAYDSSGSGANEHYSYAKYSAGWSSHQIASQGSPPAAGFSDGGAALDRADPSRVYLSKTGGTGWDLYLYQTTDSGSTWTSTALTSDGSTSLAGHIRPITPKNAASSLKAFWCFGPHYADTASGGVEGFGSQIRGYPNPVGPL